MSEDKPLGMVEEVTLSNNMNIIDRIGGFIPQDIEEIGNLTGETNILHSQAEVYIERFKKELCPHIYPSAKRFLYQLERRRISHERKSRQELIDYVKGIGQIFNPDDKKEDGQTFRAKILGTKKKS